jgi:SAM-dependent methyltransferase
MVEAEIQQKIAAYPWYHIIEVTDTLSTPGIPEYVPAQDLCLKHLKSLDLRGKRVLDIGCRDGLFSFAAERLGAAEIVGIDNDLSRGAVEFLIPFLNSKVQMSQMNLYDLKPQAGRFDIVIFPGVLYHLRYPFWALQRIREVMARGGHLLIETAILNGLQKHAILFCPVGKENPYYPDGTSCTFFNVKGLVDTLGSLGFDTLATELLAHPLKRRLDWLRRVRHAMREDGPSSVGEITRCVVHCVLRQIPKDSFGYRYWEGMHAFHSTGQT